MGTSFSKGFSRPRRQYRDEKSPVFNAQSQYQVVLLNDDYTPMDFVVGVLQIFFGMDYAGAVKVMLDVHHHGKGICGTYTRDIAETKVAQVNEFARLHEHPLLSGWRSYSNSRQGACVC